MAARDDTQPNLFEPTGFDRVEHDRPVPYALTARGRRLVDPATPDLHVVAREPRTASRGSAIAGDGAPTDAEDDVPPVGGPVDARVRALRRAGADRATIADRLDLGPLAVAVLDAPDDAPGPGPATSGPTRDGAAGGRSGGGADQRDRRRAAGLATVAVAGTVDEAGLTVTTARIRVAAALVAWLRIDEQVPAGAIRVVVRVADVATGDIVARAWADRLGLGRDRVATVAWQRAPGPRDVQAVVRVNGTDLARRVARLVRDWPADAEPASPPAPVGRGVDQGRG